MGWGKSPQSGVHMGSSEAIPSTVFTPILVSFGGKSPISPRLRIFPRSIPAQTGIVHPAASAVVMSIVLLQGSLQLIELRRNPRVEIKLHRVGYGHLNVCYVHHARAVVL